MNNKNISSKRLIEGYLDLKGTNDLLKRSKERLASHTNMLNVLINNLKEGFILLDESYQVLLVSDTVKEIFETSEERVRLIFRINDRSYVDKYNVELWDIFATKLLSDEDIKGKKIKISVGESANKKEKYLELSLKVINSEERKMYLLTFKDVTEEVRKEEENKNQKHFIETTIENIDVPIAIYDYTKEEITYSNEKMTSLIKNNKESDFGIIENIHSFKDSKLYKVIERSCTRGVIDNSVVTKAFEENGLVKYYKLKIVPFMNESQKVSIYIYCIDITDEYLYNFELEKNNKERTEFLNLLSHELRTPLTVILSSLQLVYQVYKDEIPRNLNKNLSIINTNSSKLLKLVNNILDLSKAEAGFMKNNPNTIEVVNLTENLTSSVLSYAEVKNINVIFDTNEEEVYVSIDKEKYERILLNLLSNAIKFTGENKSIYVNLNIDSNKMVLRVKDEGCGMKKEKIYSIFERYVQIEENLANYAKGTGLGLPIVKNFIEIMGGTIEVNSEILVGTEFIVSLPVEAITDIEEIVDMNLMGSNIQEKIDLEFSDLREDVSFDSSIL